MPALKFDLSLDWLELRDLIIADLRDHCGQEVGQRRYEDLERLRDWLHFWHRRLGEMAMKQVLRDADDVDYAKGNGAGEREVVRNPRNA
jgi:hypothetical protein